MVLRHTCTVLTTTLIVVLFGLIVIDRDAFILISIGYLQDYDVFWLIASLAIVFH